MSEKSIQKKIDALEAQLAENKEKGVTYPSLHADPITTELKFWKNALQEGKENTGSKRPMRRKTSRSAVHPLGQRLSIVHHNPNLPEGGRGRRRKTKKLRRRHHRSRKFHYKK